ncbi:MAG: multicopper oxidase domain-containing protein, partial [Longimicrobiales bacterium]|nr:multicopper oxidase domain-containing protein [Longimicrobiales bacterium]
MTLDLLPVVTIAGSIALFAPLPAFAQVVPDDTPSSASELRYESYRQGVGRMVDGVWRVRLTAHEVDWQPRGEGTPILRAHAFRSEEGVTHMPGPMIRVEVGTPVEVTVTNALDRSLVVRGLSDRASEGDSVAVGIGIPSPTAVFAAEPLTVEAGETRSVRFTPTGPGTFVYWGRTPPSTSPLSDEIFSADGADAPFVGPLVVDSVGGGPDPNEQVMLITRWADFAADQSTWDVSWRMMINGRAWPATERLRYTVGEPVTWRIINTSLHPHPMHLHGFFYEVHAKGDQSRDTTFAPEARRLAVTEWVGGTGQTMRIRWVPETPGNWLFHCHLIRHMSSHQRIPGEPAPSHDVAMEDHATEGMAGMVMGIHVRPDPDEEEAE